MRHDVYQYEFPLRQGELAFFDTPAIAGISGVLGAFAWWAVLYIETLEPLPQVPFLPWGEVDLTTPFAEMVFETADLLFRHQVDGFGDPGPCRIFWEDWLERVSDAFEYRHWGQDWVFSDVRSLRFAIVRHFEPSDYSPVEF